MENWLRRSPEISDQLAVDSVEFADLDECLTRVRIRDPNDFIRKLCNLFRLNITPATVRNEEHLFKLLNVNRSLKCLNLLIETEPDQELLDRLPVACPYVFQLNIEVPGEFLAKWETFYTGDWEDIWRKTGVDYGFLLKFKFLINVHLDEFNGLGQIANLFKQNPFIVQFRLAHMIQVVRNADNEHKLLFYGGLVFSSKSVDELVYRLRFQHSYFSI